LCSSNLRGLSNRDLLSRVKDLVSRERAVTLDILAHLIEVERRRLHVGLGYASMFDYCARHLGYSSSSAARRIHTARCLRDYPEVFPLLEKNEVNLSTVSLVSSILTRENYKDILERIRGKSQKEVEGIVADYRPPVSMRDRARPVWVAVPSSGPAEPKARTAGALFSPASGGDREPEVPMTGSAARGSDSAAPRDTASTQRTSRCDSSRCGSGKTPNSAGGTVRFEKKQFVQFVASEQFVKKLERAKALLSNGRGELSYERVLEAALDEFLKDHDPEERNKRREQRREKAEAGSGSLSSGPLSSSERAGSGQADDPSCGCDRAGGGQADGPLFRRRAGGLSTTRFVSDRGLPRRIPAAVRDAVFARDKGRCAFIGSNGKRCGATQHLQIDHIELYARGGANTHDNLRLLCERHNKHEAERVLGANTIRVFRQRR
jgi:hypothetical protein